MGDQSLSKPTGNTNRTPSRLAGLDGPTVGPRARSGQIKRRFRRRATELPASPDFVAQLARLSGDQVPVVGQRRVNFLTPPVIGTDPVLPQAETLPAETQADMWDLLPRVASGVRQHFLSGAPLINFFRNDPAARAFDILRTRMLQALRSNGWNRIAIASPTSGCGATFTAVNLAQSLARVPGSRTVLMDINHRAPGISKLLEIDKAGDMRGFLNGDISVESHMVRASKTLALGLATQQENGAAEILHDTRCGAALGEMQRALRPDVTLFDLPPVLDFDDLSAFLPQVDGVFLVVDGTNTTARQIAECEKILNGQTQLLGIILNRARKGGVE
ncbi:MAG: CpsD/CapB family tyrosine-protein kinase [Rhodobacteraceae bacterium]|nr:CpsD/CapB family tyrosine-protein kinase [Paracoccaceae bacterium]